MATYDDDKKKLLQQTVLAKIDDVLKRGKKSDTPAFTLILGAGASFGVVPTAKEMLGFPEVKSGRSMKSAFLFGWHGKPMMARS